MALDTNNNDNNPDNGPMSVRNHGIFKTDSRQPTSTMGAVARLAGPVAVSVHQIDGLVSRCPVGEKPADLVARAAYMVSSMDRQFKALSMARPPEPHPEEKTVAPTA